MGWGASRSAGNARGFSGLEALERRLLLTVYAGDMLYTLFTNRLQESAQAGAPGGVVVTGRDGAAFVDVVNVKKASVSYDDVTHVLTLGVTRPGWEAYAFTFGSCVVPK